jgi:signal peptidase II
VRTIHYITAFFLVILDLTTKWLALGRIHPGEEISILPGFFQLILAKNPGVAFSLFSDGESIYKVAVFSLINLLGLALIIFLGHKMVFSWRLAPFCLSLIMAGILGNSIDRLVHGWVTDYLDFFLSSYHWPAFNLADSCITVGVFTLAIYELFFQKEGSTFSRT